MTTILEPRHLDDVANIDDRLAFEDVAELEQRPDRDGASPDRSTGRPGGSRLDRLRHPTPAGWITAGIALLTAVLYGWGLSSVGMANSYYAAAVKSMTISWKAFFFGAIDPASFITVDKPPAALWA